MYSRKVLSCLMTVALAATMFCVPVASASELTVAAADVSQLDRLKSQAIAKIDNGRTKYKKDMTAAKRKSLKALRARVSNAKKESAVATALGKAEVIVINAKLLHNDKAKAVKKSTSLYKSYKGMMDKGQRTEFVNNKKSIVKAVTQKALKKLLEKRELMVDRAKLAKYIDTKGWTRKRIDFVSEWGKRNNNYLSGTPMAGTGYYIVNAAYKTNIDPRLYSAISEIESGRGRQPYGNKYNVCGWIWNPPSMSSWQDAAEKWHAYFKSKFAGKSYPLTSMYGYCGYSPWYVNKEMAKI